jgi:hypothetical protein
VEYIVGLVEIIFSGTFAVLLSAVGIILIGLLVCIPVIAIPEYKKFEDTLDQYELRQYRNQLKQAFFIVLLLAFLFSDAISLFFTLAFSGLLIIAGFVLLILLPFLLKIGLDEKNDMNPIDRRQLEDKLVSGGVLFVSSSSIYIAFFI